jgi:hypothetical protein
MIPNADLKQVNVHQLMQRFQSKKELHNFLCQDCRAFMPKPESTNVYYLKQIMQGQKEVRNSANKDGQYIKRENIKVSSVPQYEGLALEDFIDYARAKPQLLKFLPDEKDWLKLDKKWICDVLYTLDTEGIQNMIDTAVARRRAKVETSKDLMVNMRPEFVSALENSLSFSSKDQGL